MMGQSVKLVLLAVVCCSYLAKAQTEIPDPFDQDAADSETSDVIDENSTNQPERTGRIIGGTNADIANYPYMASMLVHSQYDPFYFGGVVITATHVLTAASSFNTMIVTSIVVRVGSSFLTKGGKTFNYKSYEMHNLHNLTTLANDVALVTIDGSFRGIPNVAPIRLEHHEYFISAAHPINCFVLGWGDVVPGQLADRLQRSEYILLNHQQCEAKWGPRPTSVQCAQSVRGNACHFDDGGPLMCNNRMYGVLSYFNQLDCENTTSTKIHIFGKIPAPSIQIYLHRKLHDFGFGGKAMFVVALRNSRME
ncbi:chymotrypsin-2-like [Anopheles aquasalis]|uniref:chymotrypsin-2-like n=1 Tax=Anopheles aquasalis TaxID=42839 RepID=UPI00215A9C2E|nr:chymotrypsin-2-like [Anopheles aquasalis]